MKPVFRNLLFPVLVSLLPPITVAHADEAATTAEAAAAAPADLVSLPHALEVAVRQSPALVSATIDLRVAEASVLEASGIQDWVLAANGSFSLTRDTAVSGSFISTNESDSSALDASISRLLSTGGTVSLALSGSRRRSVFEFMNTESLNYNTDLTLSISQPLLKGRGSAVTLAGRQQSEYGRDIATLARESAVRAAVRDIVLAYWEVAFAHRSLEIRRGALALSRERLRLTQRRVSLGNAAPTELTAVDQIIATREEEILSAELSVSERSLDLRRLAGLEVGPGDIDLRTTEIAAAKPQDLPIDDILKRAYASSPEIATLATRGKGATLDLEVTDNGLLPQLDFSLGGGPLGTSDSAGDALKKLGKANGYQVSARLSYQQSLGNKTAGGAHQRAVENRRQIKVDMTDLRAQIAVSVVRAVKAARSAQRRMDLSQRVIALSKKNIAAEQRRFELGRSTNFDVLQRQDELEQAQLRYARASVDYLRARALIDALTGDILSRYGISAAEPNRPAP